MGAVDWFRDWIETCIARAGEVTESVRLTTCGEVEISGCGAEGLGLTVCRRETELIGWEAFWGVEFRPTAGCAAGCLTLFGDANVRLPIEALEKEFLCEVAIVGLTSCCVESLSTLRGKIGWTKSPVGEELLRRGDSLGLPFSGNEGESGEGQ